MADPCSDSTSEHILGSFTPEDFYANHGVIHTEDYITNARGMRLCTRSWTPMGPDPKVRGTIMVCHGYGDDAGWLLQLTCIALAKRGFAVYAIDYQGHGKSEGLRAHIPDVNTVLDDCIAFFDPKREAYKSLPSFLYGESLGGAISLLIHLRQPGVWSGLILNGPMCNICRKFKPPWPAEHLLHLVGNWIPTWPVVPTRDITTISFKEPWKRELARNNPTRYAGKPRAATAIEFLRIVKEIQLRSSEVSAPLLIIHGEFDVVADPEGSKILYKQASSSDKTLRIYTGMWHQLIGEPPENFEKVLGDIYFWLDSRIRC